MELPSVVLPHTGALHTL